MTSFFITISYMALTVAGYLFFRHIYSKWPHPLLHVVPLTTALIIIVLVATKAPYADYEPAKDILTFFMGPATVALALPLYRYRNILRDRALPLLGCVALGSFLSMALAGLVAALGGMPEAFTASVMPKGTSTPFAVEIAAFHSGIPALASAFVVATGVFGAFSGLCLLTLCKIYEPTARGLAMGVCFHAIGTVASLEEGELQGAMAGLAMILSGLFSALFAPFILPLLRLLGSS